MKNNSVFNLFDNNKYYKEDYGIEIEMETKSPIYYEESFNDKIWKPDFEEHSIKGYGIEVYLRKPINFNKVDKTISDTHLLLEQTEVSIKDSIRAGVHVHLNVQDWTMKEVYKFLSCYYPLETVMTNYAGEGRQGNLFCLRARDAELIMHSLIKAVEKENPQSFYTDDLRYSALNFQSLFSHGTLEFRALRTHPELKTIYPWVSMIECLKNYSKTNPDIIAETNNISYAGPNNWLMKIFGPQLYKELEYPNMEHDVMKDIRNCQMFLHTLKSKGMA